MRAPPLASLCLSLSLSLVAASETATNPPAPSSFTCVSGGGDRGGSCFVASCAQLHAAVDAGVSHITLYRNLTAADDARCAFPLRVSRPLTVRGACGDGTSKCSVSGGGVLVRQDRSACRQRCTRCENGEGPLFDVRDGGRLTLANLELRGACNARDGAGGAVVVRSNYRKKVEKGDVDVCSPASIESKPSAWAEADEAAAAVRDLKDERTAAAGLFHETEFDDENVDDDENVFENASASLVAVGVAFVENLAVGGGGDAGNTNTDGRYGRSSSPPNGRGGAVAVFGASASATFLECAFEGNEAWGSASAGAIDAYAADVGEGGAVFLRRGVARVFRSAFTRNVAEKEGGAVYADRGARVSLEASTFSGNVVADDYWDGGGAVFLGDQGTSARADVARFVGNQVAVYPDARRKALTCGGGAVSVVRGAEAVFKYALFERNAAPRGARCARTTRRRASRRRGGAGTGGTPRRRRRCSARTSPRMTGSGNQGGRTWSACSAFSVTDQVTRVCPARPPRFPCRNARSSPTTPRERTARARRRRAPSRSKPHLRSSRGLKRRRRRSRFPDRGDRGWVPPRGLESAFAARRRRVSWSRRSRRRCSASRTATATASPSS